MQKKFRRPPTRHLAPKSQALPVYGPEATGITPRLAPSIYCSWCGLETVEIRGAKVCADCDKVTV